MIKFENSITTVHEIDLLKEFYNSLENARYDYKVHLTQQSYALSQIFNGEKTKYGENYITSTALLALTTEIADYYMKYDKKFPKILICDLLIESGQYLNAFLIKLENELIGSLRNMRCEDDEINIRTKITYAIDIKVVYKNEKSSIVLSRYLARTKTSKIATQEEVNILKKEIAELLLEYGTSNNNFDIRALVNKSQLELLNIEYKKIETLYMQNTQISYIKIIECEGNVKAILTVRTSEEDNGMCYIKPNIFIANLKKEDKENFLSMFIDRITDRNIKEKFINQQNNLKTVEDEFISMLLNQMLLQVFISEGSLKEDESYLEYEINRITCNFGKSLELYDIISYIKRNKIFIDNEEFIKIITSLTKNSKPIYKIIDERKADKEEILNHMEEFIYNKSLENEKFVYELWKNGYIQTKLQEKIIHNRLYEFLEDMCKNHLPIYETVAYMLQLMDNDMLVIKEHFDYQDDKSDYIQYYTAGNCAIFTKLMNMNKYIALCTAIMRRCRGGRQNFEKELSKCGEFLTDTEISEIKELLKEFQDIGLQIDDYDVYVTNENRCPVKKNDFCERIRLNYTSIDEQKKLVEAYRKTYN